MIEYYQQSERNSYCLAITNSSNYISSTNKSFPFHSSSTNSTSIFTFIFFLLSTIQWIFLQIWNIFSLICHIIGLPLDGYIINCLSSCLNIYHILKNRLGTMFQFNLLQNNNIIYQNIQQNENENENRREEKQFTQI